MKKMKIIKNLAFGLLGLGVASATIPFVVSCGSKDENTSSTDQNPIEKPHNDNSGGKPNTDSGSTSKPESPTQPDSGSTPSAPEAPTEPDGGDVQPVIVNDQATLEMLSKKFPSGITSHGFKYRIVQKQLQNPTKDI